MCALYESDVNLNTTAFLPTGKTEAEEQENANEFNTDTRYGAAPRTAIYSSARVNEESDEDARGIHRRRRWTHEEKKSIVAETEGPGQSISGVARKYGIAPRLLFSWRRQLSDEMTLTTRSGAKIVPVSVVRELEKRITELEDLVEQKNAEISTLHKALNPSGAREAYSPQL